MRWAFAAILSGLCIATPARADVDARVLRMTRVPRSLVNDAGKVPLLVRVPPGVAPEDRALLPVAPGFGAIWLAPEQLDAYLSTYDDVVASVAPPRHKLIDYASIRWTGVFQVRAETGLDGTGVVVGIIDTGLDTSHGDFRDAEGKTRVAWLMQREGPRGMQPELEARYGCSDEESPCAIYSAADIDALLTQNPDEAPRDDDGHGTHVASLAAGNGRGSPPPFVYAGTAPGATIIIASPSEGGGFRDADILRAASFIFDQAAALGMPAVVNVSLGSDFGPHDGTSALEQGLAAMVGDDKPGRVLVVAAGNSGEIFDLEDGHFYGIHTEAHVASHGVTRVPIVQPGADDTIDGSGFVWVNFRPGDEVSVGLEGPDGSRWLSLTGPGDELGHNEDNLSAGVVNNLVNGKTSLTEETNGAVVFWDGEWENGEFAVLLEGRGDAQLWVTGTGQAGPSLFSTGLVFTRALRTGTVAVPASHQDLIAVGCTLNRSEWATVGGLLVSPKLEPALEDSMCDFSGAGPTPIGAMKPDLLAPGGFIAGAMSRDADPRSDPTSIFALPGCQEQTCALVDDTHAITQGTSMSAPQVAGAAALLLERDPQLTQRQVREVLQAGARRPTGIVPFDYQQGPGVLDMRGAVQVLDERSTGKLATVGKSFYVLGSPYLRPTPNWPVRGVVQLRLDDGSVAMGAAVRDLTIAIDNGGLVVEPLQQMRAGTFTFALGAPRGTAGRLVNVEVFYRGQSLGRRTLAVAVDRWRAGRDFTAVGGCSVSPRAGDPSLLLLLVLLAWTRGGRRLDGARGELRERSSSSGTC